MARRKTRQQKIIAELRRQLSVTREPAKSQVVPGVEAVKPTPKAEKRVYYPTPKTTSVKHLTYTNPYLAKDLRKTAILTAGIVLGQLLLFLLFRQHILILP